MPIMINNQSISDVILWCELSYKLQDFVDLGKTQYMKPPQHPVSVPAAGDYWIGEL